MPLFYYQAKGGTKVYDKTVDFIKDFLPWILVILGYFFEVSKIPISPFSMIRDWILKPVNDRIDTLEKEFRKEKHRILVDRIYDIRKTIIDFSDSCRNHEHHTQKEFQDIIDLHTKYLDLCEKADIANGVISVEYQYILDTYKKVKEENDFM